MHFTSLEVMLHEETAGNDVAACIWNTDAMEQKVC